MMNRDDAARIAEAITMIRPDWLKSSLLTMLHDLRAKDALEVHLALVWIAYDPATKTPGRVREEGPWWHLLGAKTPAAPADRSHDLPRWRDDLTDTPRADPATVAKYANQVRQAAREATIPERPKEKP